MHSVWALSMRTCLLCSLAHRLIVCFCRHRSWWCLSLIMLNQLRQECSIPPAWKILFYIFSFCNLKLYSIGEHYTLHFATLSHRLLCLGIASVHRWLHSPYDHLLVADKIWYGIAYKCVRIIRWERMTKSATKIQWNGLNAAMHVRLIVLLSVLISQYLNRIKSLAMNFRTVSIDSYSEWIMRFSVCQ